MSNEQPVDLFFAHQGPFESEKPSTIVSKIDFRKSFTNDELIAIYTAAKTDVQVEIWLDGFKLDVQVDLSEPSVLVGLEFLESKALLASGRAREILGLEPLPVIDDTPPPVPSI